MKNSVVLVSGHFNILHPGHQRLLKFAKEAGEKLIVAVESDRLAGDAAHVPENLRLEGIKSCLYVDEAFILDGDIVDLIEARKPNIVVKGKEFENRLNTELDALLRYGGRLLFSSGDSRFSSLDLIRREASLDHQITIDHASKFIKRNDINIVDLERILQRFEGLKVVVVGDLIVDEYITCEPLGMSQEDPTVVVTPVDTSLYIGGAGIVAAHAAGLGASVKFVSISGDDKLHKFCKEKLESYSVESYLIKDSSRPTTLKQRYRCQGKSLLRVSHLREAGASIEIQKKIFEALTLLIKDCDLLIFSDFNYGCLPTKLVQEISDIAVKNNILMVADSQSSSQVGDISRFNGMSLITPTEREARISLRDGESGLIILAERLMRESKSKNILLKMGEEGLLIYSQLNGNVVTDRLPAFNENPRDVAGAGDSLLVASALALASGANILEAACLGSVAAAIQVGRLGNKPINKVEFREKISNLLN